MLKAKQYNFADSNIALFGTDVERKVKEAAAETEEAWQGTGQEPELRVWRIVQFKVEAWEESRYGEFYDGDSYIVLNVYKKPGSDALAMDVHFWIGRESTQDEYGTAAYKTVELDTYHRDVPVQHREVMGYESDLFLSYFDKFGGVSIIKGGADSGFRHVEAEQVKTRLLRVQGNIRHQSIIEVELGAGSLFTGDAFILDTQETVFVWQGAGANPGEKMKAGQIAQALKDERGGAPDIVTFSEGGENDAFWEALGGEGELAAESSRVELPNERKLIKLSDASGQLEMTDVECSPDSLDSDDVFIFDAGHEIFVWVGKGASDDERKYAMGHADKYARQNNPFVPCTRILEGAENEVFNSILAA